MTPEKVLRVIGLYRQLFENKKIPKIDFPHNLYLGCINGGLAHCHGMLNRITEFVLEGRMEKAFRWLGFVQGVLWATGVATLDDLKNANRPDEGESEGKDRR